MTDKIIAQGAEANIYLTKDNTIKKVRVKKNYRINEIDDELIKTRNKREKKIYEKLIVNHPKLISSGEDFIEIEYLEGDILKNVFDVNYCEQIGEMIAKMHDNEIIHGDLTTSNMILKDNMIYFIDFGLSFFSKKVEDKAVDLHLLYHAFESKHYQVFEEGFKQVLKGYKKSKDYTQVMERFEVVESRGRNKN
jgi:Kae1-associated kinase Bud32